MLGCYELICRRKKGRFGVVMFLGVNHTAIVIRSRITISIRPTHGTSYDGTAALNTYNQGRAWEIFHSVPAGSSSVMDATAPAMSVSFMEDSVYAVNRRL